MRIESRKHSQDVTQMLQDWSNSITQTDTPTLHRLGMVKGVLATCGCTSIHKEGDLIATLETSEMKSALKKIIWNLEASNDTLISLTTARLLGELHLSSNDGPNTSSQLPLSYHYVGESSLLASLFDLLQRETVHVCSVFEIFLSIECSKLPPVNWSSVLNPVFQSVGVAPDVKENLLEFALKFAPSCTDLSLWISSCIQPSLFSKLNKEIQTRMLSSASRVLHVLPNSKQRILLEDLSLVALGSASTNSSSDAKHTLLEHIIEAWLEIAEMPIPIQSSFTYLVEGVKRLINNVPNISKVINDFRIVLLASFSCQVSVLFLWASFINQQLRFNFRTNSTKRGKI
jgi:Protein of unknown function (DUF3028).